MKKCAKVSVFILCLFFFFKEWPIFQWICLTLVSWKHEDTQICHLLFFDQNILLFRKQKLQVYFSFCPRDFTHLFCIILQGQAIRYICFVSSLNGFKLFYLEAISSGNEEGLSQLATWIPVNCHPTGKQCTFQ